MTILQQDSSLGVHASVVAYNATSTMMASAHEASVSVFERTTSEPSWTALLYTQNEVKQHLQQGEKIATLTWAHPQYGALLALGTSYGRVMLMSRLSGEASPTVHENQAPTMDGSNQTWKVDHVLLTKESKASSPVMCLAFSPTSCGVTLGVASADGMVRLLTCSACHPLLHHARWRCTHTLVPPLPSRSQGHGGSSSSSPCTCLHWQPHPDPSAMSFILSTEWAASIWTYDSNTMDWVCTCPDLEATCGYTVTTSQPGVGAWAPLVGRSKELVAVARGDRVCILALDGDLLKPHVQQVGEVLKGMGPVWKVQWDCFALQLAVSCEEDEQFPASVLMWRMGIQGGFGPEPTSVVQAASVLGMST